MTAATLPQHEKRSAPGLSPAERVAAAFEGRRTGRIPVHHNAFSAKAESLVLDRQADGGGGCLWYREACALWEGPDAHAEFLERNLRDAVELGVRTGQDLIRPVYWRRMTRRPTRRLDEFTFMYGDPGAAHEVWRYDPPTELYQAVTQHPVRNPTLEDLRLEVERDEQALDGFRPGEALFAQALRARELLGGTYAVRCKGAGLSIPYDPAIWLEATMEEPELVGRYLDLQVERARRIAELAGRLNLPYLFGGGDFATNQGPMYSPRVFRELMLPRLQRITAACRQAGVKALFGTDGNTWPVADDLFGASGVDGYYEIDGLAGMDLRRLRERFPRLTLVGNISSLTLHMGTRDKVIRETEAALAAAHDCGGMLVGCSNLIVPETPPENLWAMLETIEKGK